MKGQLSLQLLLPPSVGIEPYELFSLFIPESLYAIISKHINLYAGLHQAGEDGNHTWKPRVNGQTTFMRRRQHRMPNVSNAPSIERVRTDY